jgi:glycosyltransferase involved in cell wall biosynthesis
MEPVVSVSMCTYQHERFIAQAIEGVLMQQTSFTVQLVLGEDFSTDGTRAICESYAAKYGDRIKLLPSDKNLGQSENLLRTLKACTGKYLASCEGDDFWTDPYKLQKQVDFLEANPEYVLCFHQVDVVDQDGNLLEDRVPADITRYNSLSLFHTFVPTPSMLFRNCIQALPDEFFKVKSTDAFICGMLTAFGDAADLGFVGASYRKHPGGMYNQLSMLNRFKQSIHTRKLMVRSPFFSNEQRKEIRRELKKRGILYMKSFLKKKEFMNCVRIAAFYLTAR